MTKKTKNKTKRLDTRVDDEEYNLIQTKATQAGITVSEFIRRAAINRQLPTFSFNKEIYQILIEIKTELNRIGTNINQIARACNTSIQLGEPVVVNINALEKAHNSFKKTTQKLDKIKNILFKTT